MALSLPAAVQDAHGITNRWREYGDRLESAAKLLAQGSAEKPKPREAS